MSMRITDMPEFKDKTEVLTIEQTSSLAAAIDGMCQRGVGSILITNKGKLAGILTERDVLNRIAGAGLDIAKTKLVDVMTKDLKTAKADDQIMDCMRRMSKGRFRHLPIVNEKGDVVGLLSQGDFVALTMSQAWDRLTTTAKEGIFSNYQPFLILLGVAIYTIVLISFLSH
jgi:CBS domain-containing protein